MAEFVEFKKSAIWEHFLREKNGKTAQCKLCPTILKTNGSSTKGLHEHIRCVHNLNIIKITAENDTQPSTSSHTRSVDCVSGSAGQMKKFLLEYSEQSLPAVLSRMTACDGLPFRVFVTSKDLRRALLSMGFSKLPNSPESIKQLVMQHGWKIQATVTCDLTKKKEHGKRFSLPLMNGRPQETAGT